jgi:hypothetical protein
MAAVVITQTNAIVAEEPGIVAQPTRLEAYIGGLFGDSFRVTFDGKNLAYHARTRESDDILGIASPVDQTIAVTASQANWQAFRRDLDNAHVWDWKQRYDNKTIADGTQWRLIVTYTDRTISSAGSNAYPPEKQFQAFLVAVSRLVGNRAFE